MKKLILATLVTIIGFWSSLDAQKVALRTNLLGLATGNINVEGSMYISPRLTFHVPIQAKLVGYPLPAPVGLIRWMESTQPDSYIDHFGTVKHTENISIFPGIRHWWRGAYNRGFFTGYYAIGTWFRWGGDKFDVNYREGFGLGGGASIGYSYEISPRWNIEAEFGLGALWRDYEYIDHQTKSVIETKQDIIATIPKVGISLVYILK